MTRQEALDKLSAAVFALQESNESEWKLVEEVMVWIEGLPVAVHPNPVDVRLALGAIPPE